MNIGAIFLLINSSFRDSLVEGKNFLIKISYFYRNRKKREAVDMMWFKRGIGEVGKGVESYLSFSQRWVPKQIEEF